MIRRKLSFFFLPFLLVFSACQDAAPSPAVVPTNPPHTAEPTTIPEVVQPTPSIGQTQTQILVSPTDALPAETPTPAPTPGPTPNIAVHPGTGELYEVVFSIPVGRGSLNYQGVGAVDAQITGPDAFTVLSDGTFAISDPVSRVIRLYDPVGNPLPPIDLLSLDIHILTDMVAVNNDLLVLEVGYGPLPEKNHIYRISKSGDLITTYELPSWATLENGLYGLEAGPQGEVLLWMNGMTRLYQIVAASGEINPVLVEGLSYQGRIYRAQGRFGFVGEVAFETDLTQQGGLQVLWVNPDGSFYLLRTDAVVDQVIQVDQTVHYMSSQGMQLGVSRPPAREALYYVDRSLAVGPDGSVYLLLPRRTTVDVVRLNFYQELEPFLPGAAQPVISISK